AAPEARAPERRGQIESRPGGERFEHGRQGAINVERGRELERIAHERRHLDIDGERRHSFYWSRFRPGFGIGVLPPGYVQIGVGGAPYYYYEGVYYEPAPTGYVAVPPPVGAAVAEPPPGAGTLVAWGATVAC